MMHLGATPLRKVIYYPLVTYVAFWD